jgi:acyl-ACP thioesterase
VRPPHSKRFSRGTPGSLSELMDAGGSRAYSTTWRVRTYELDANGHVNNAVFVAYAEEVANQHAEALGFGRAWTQ